MNEIQDIDEYENLVEEEDFTSLNERLKIKPGRDIKINGNEEESFNENQMQK